jgi:hypothetical protein
VWVALFLAMVPTRLLSAGQEEVECPFSERIPVVAVSVFVPPDALAADVWIMAKSFESFASVRRRFGDIAWPTGRKLIAVLVAEWLPSARGELATGLFFVEEWPFKGIVGESMVTMDLKSDCMLRVSFFPFDGAQRVSELRVEDESLCTFVSEETTDRNRDQTFWVVPLAFLDGVGNDAWDRSFCVPAYG